MGVGCAQQIPENFAMSITEEEVALPARKISEAKMERLSMLYLAYLLGDHSIAGHIINSDKPNQKNL